MLTSLSPSLRKKSVLKTFRIDEYLGNLLEEDARNKKISVNTLVNLILARYAEWDRFTDRYTFITVTREGFNQVIQALDENTLINIGQDLGSRLPKDFVVFWFKKLNIETFLAYQSLFCRYGRTADVETKVEGREYAISFHHELGEKWSKYLRAYLSSAMKTLFGIVPEFDLTKSSVIMTFMVSKTPPAGSEAMEY
jgi:hypothetical protein